MVYYHPVPTRNPVMVDTRNFFGNAAGTRLFMNELNSDLSICVKWNNGRWHFPAHQLILGAMSEVFRTMFRTDMQESSDGTLVITDYSPLTVKQFLRYMYIGVLDFNGWIEAVDLMKIAHKYSVYALVTLCETHLSTVITFSNVCCLYEIAQTYSLDSLKKDASILILDAAFIVTSTEGFFHMKPASLEFFISSPKLNMENECCVLSTLKEWAVVECSRRGNYFTRDNILSAMEPFMNHIKWDLIPEELRTFVPEKVIKKYTGQSSGLRKAFHVSGLLQYHVSIMKFVVELGAFCENRACDNGGLCCLKFGVDNHAYLCGFKIVGMFRCNSLTSLGPSSLILGRDGSRSSTKFNLHSLPWTKGAIVGEYIWREMTAYLPYPVRIDPFSPYVFSLNYTSRSDPSIAKWPVTRLEYQAMVTDLGPINFHCYSACYGITQLYMLPAPPNRNACNITD